MTATRPPFLMTAAFVLAAAAIVAIAASPFLGIAAHVLA